MADIRGSHSNNIYDDVNNKNDNDVSNSINGNNDHNNDNDNKLKKRKGKMMKKLFSFRVFFRYFIWRGHSWLYRVFAFFKDSFTFEPEKLEHKTFISVIQKLIKKYSLYRV